MRVVFMGTPEFAVPSLAALARAHDVVAVYTRPDAVSGRGGKTRPSPVKLLAMELNIPVQQPPSLRDAEQVTLLRGYGADIIAVAAYGLLLPQAALDAAPLGAVNVHASLLPRWRGAAPIQRAILAGDSVTGVSIMRMEAGLDTGPYCSQVSLDLDDLSAPQATAALADLGAAALLAALAGIASGTATWSPQDGSLATYAEKLAKADVAIAPSMGVGEALRRLRAAMPAAPCRITIAGRGVTLLHAHVSDAAVRAGALCATKSSLVLGFADGAIELKRVKPDGKAEMDAAAWARGVRGLAELTWAATS